MTSDHFLALQTFVVRSAFALPSVRQGPTLRCALHTIREEAALLRHCKRTGGAVRIEAACSAPHSLVARQTQTRCVCQIQQPRRTCALLRGACAVPCSDESNRTISARARQSERSRRLDTMLQCCGPSALIQSAGGQTVTRSKASHAPWRRSQPCPISWGGVVLKVGGPSPQAITSTKALSMTVS